MHRVQCMRQLQKKKGYATAISKRRWQRKAYGDIRAAVFRLYKWNEEQRLKREKEKENPPAPKPLPQNRPGRVCQFWEKGQDDRPKPERMESASRRNMRAKFKATEDFFRQDTEDHETAEKMFPDDPEARMECVIQLRSQRAPHPQLGMQKKKKKTREKTTERRPRSEGIKIVFMFLTTMMTICTNQCPLSENMSTGRSFLGAC